MSRKGQFTKGQKNLMFVWYVKLLLNEQEHDRISFVLWNVNLKAKLE